MTEKRVEMRVFALASAGIQMQIRRQLAPLGITIDFVEEIAELSHFALSRGSYPVAIVPAALPDNGWWALWGELALLSPRPEVLVYAHTASFELWSSVLELGGYDILVEPFADDELPRAVLLAAKSFEERLSGESGNE